MRKERNRTRVSDKVRERRIRTCLYGLPFFNVRRYSLTPTMAITIQKSHLLKCSESTQITLNL